MPDEDMIPEPDVVDANFCTTCGNPLTTEGKCATCGFEPDECTCTGNEEVSPVAAAEAASHHEPAV